MTRGILVTSLLGASLALGLLTAIVQSHNRAEGARLDAQREDCMLLEAVHGAQRAAILEIDHGPLQNDEEKPAADSRDAQRSTRGAE